MTSTLASRLIPCMVIVGLLCTLAPIAQAQSTVKLFEEHWVDPEGGPGDDDGIGENPGWGPTRQEYNWPAPTDEDWVAGLSIAEYPSTGPRWVASGSGNHASYNLSNLYEQGDQRVYDSSGIPGAAPSPDNDGWHFAGIHDNGGNDTQMQTTAGTVSIAQADRNDTQLDLHYASNYNTDHAFHVTAKVDGNWYSTAELGIQNGQYGGGSEKGCVFAWATLNVDIENETWYDYNNVYGAVDPGRFDIGTTPYTGLPEGEIQSIGFMFPQNGNGEYFALDNIIISATVPALSWDGGAGSWFSTTQWDGGEVSAGADMIIDAENDGAEPPVVSGPSVVTVDADFVDGGDGPAKSITLGAIGDSTNDAQLKIDVGVTLEVTGATTVEEFGKLISQVQGNDTDVTAEAGVVETDELAIHGADSIQVDWTPGSDATSMFGGVYTIAEYAGTALADFGESANAAGNIGGAYVKNTDYAVDVNGDGSLYAVEVELHGQGVGDTDLDGVVGPADLADFGLGWSPNGTDKTWFEGDFDFNGNVDPADLAAFGLAWAPNGIAFPAETGIGVVPEPGTALMMLISMATLLIYRKRR